MTKNNHQADLFGDTQPEKTKEDTMNEQDLRIKKLNEHSRMLKYKPFGINHPDRLKGEDTVVTASKTESFNLTEI